MIDITLSFLFNCRPAAVKVNATPAAIPSQKSRQLVAHSAIPLRRDRLQICQYSSCRAVRAAWYRLGDNQVSRHVPSTITQVCGNGDAPPFLQDPPSMRNFVPTSPPAA